MNRWLSLVALATIGAAGCKKVPYVVYLEGEWAGTATDSAGAALPMTVDWSYDEGDDYFYGVVDFNGYLFNVDGVTADKKSADVTLVSPLSIGTLGLTGVAADEEEMQGDFSLNLTVPVQTTQTGTFSLKLQ